MKHVRFQSVFYFFKKKSHATARVRTWDSAATTQCLNHSTTEALHIFKVLFLQCHSQNADSPFSLAHSHLSIILRLHTSHFNQSHS